MKEWPKNLAVLDQKPPQVVKVDPTLRVVPKETSCLDPGKKDYQVPELEAAIQCKDAYIGKLKGRFNSLAKASAQAE